MASAAELLRAASAIIEAGWSQGANARDGAGHEVPLYGGTTSRASINPAAVAFSLYGAVCKATSEAGVVTRLPLVWDVLYRLAWAANDHPSGGTNYVHPVLQFNDAQGRTKEDVMGLLELAAQDCEAIGTGPFPPPVTVHPNQVETV